MPLPRHKFVTPGVAGYYHCISRCVRRSWLCGIDPITRQDFNHRRKYILDRMKFLTECFAADILAYAILSNHYHVVVHMDPDRIATWSDKEVIQRWSKIWHWRSLGKPTALTTNIASADIVKWRERLGDLSWFMRTLNEPIARIANKEDECTGRFWEGRFKSIPLLDDGSVVSCMTYVDLNPIRAGVAETIEQSDFTSIQERVKGLYKLMESDRTANSRKNVHRNSNSKNQDEYPDDAGSNNTPLTPIASSSKSTRGFSSLTATQYIELVRSSAGIALAETNAWRDDLVDELGLTKNGWRSATLEFLALFRTAAGSNENYKKFMERTNRKRQRDTPGRKLLYK